jgi:hypothetical protein
MQLWTTEILNLGVREVHITSADLRDDGRRHYFRELQVRSAQAGTRVGR